MKIKEIDLVELLRGFWEWVVGIQHWNTFEGWAARIVVWILVIYVLLFVTKHVLEMLAKISESWKSLGFEVRKSPEDRAKLRRSQQFCKVLASDLATIAKAESWNDQFFTDLEAEVEAEGGYYATSVDRFLGRKSHGLRRVPSLIQAIESTTEQCLLVTGDPGSGKSVALRHLANQMAEAGSKSKSVDQKIPLYLNLKELPPAPYEGPSADFIREFVLENIRRGDADTAAYVRENWAAYRESGRWFFLFDSFDEIPAVLHAPTGSPAIRQHADAIRHFFEGMSACKGVLASRQFKGPDTLPWNKFKVLPLSLPRQDELIENSFLSQEEKRTAAQHTAASVTGLLTNPLFLTLLCRYIKQEGALPANDNELLWRHVCWLANREPEYVKKRYSLLPAQLIEGSIQLAVLFAEQPSLSLAPTQDQIANALGGVGVPGGDLEKLLAAIIDVKIGRCDVKEAKAGDRRFTFAHRRYQETLFVRHLASVPNYLSARSLLTDLRWRDYTVTLLQTGSHSVVLPILETARTLLNEYAARTPSAEVIPDFGSELVYFNWKEAPGATLLNLLQDGLRQRLSEVPSEIRVAVKDYLATPWNKGDSQDRLMVISLGGLMPEEDLRECLEWAISHGVMQHWDAAVSSSMFLTEMPEEMADWFRNQLAERLLSARDRSELLKVEAIAARLPDSFGAKWIVGRVREIKGRFFAIERFIQAKLPFWKRIEESMSNALAARFRRRIVETIDLYLLSFPVGAIAVGITLWEKTMLGALLTIVFGTWAAANGLRRVWLQWFRAMGDRITISSLQRLLTKTQKGFLQKVSTLSRVTAVGIGSLGALGGLIHLCAWLLGYEAKSVAVFYLVGPIALALAAAVVMAVVTAYDELCYMRNFRSAIHSGNSRLPLVLQASSWDEVRSWLRSQINETIPTKEHARSLLRLIRAVDEGFEPLGNNPKLNNQKSLNSLLVTLLTQRLLVRFHELDVAILEASEPHSKQG